MTDYSDVLYRTVFMLRAYQMEEKHDSALHGDADMPH
jgi:hypothetical protein